MGIDIGRYRRSGVTHSVCCSDGIHPVCNELGAVEMPQTVQRQVAEIEPGAEAGEVLAHAVRAQWAFSAWPV